MFVSQMYPYKAFGRVAVRNNPKSPRTGDNRCVCIEKGVVVVVNASLAFNLRLASVFTMTGARRSPQT